MKKEELKMYNAPTPDFCRKCGRSLIMSRYESHFNQKSGEQEYHYILKCPRAWGLFGNEYTSHSHFTFSETGGEILSYDY